MPRNYRILMIARIIVMYFRECHANVMKKLQSINKKEKIRDVINDDKQL